jgi:alginate O-acetyltransferase complex protein AlgI
MLFNSNDFLQFFGCFLAIYLLCARSLAWRNLLIVVASYIFYSFWDPRFTVLLFATSVIDYSVARAIGASASERVRKRLVATSVTANLLVLGTFKYFNFFRESLEQLLNQFGAGMHGHAWRIVLPVGVSFYTFQSIGYVVDVYRRRLEPCRNFVRFLAFVSFFPQLVAGPIERGAHMLPQFSRTLEIRRADIEAGLWLVLWGMFKKVVIADNLAPLVDLVFDHPVASGPMVILGTVAFGLQIYCDFSGYTDIARGVARLLGFELMLNFNLPYFATSVRDFWGRWHISLSTWLRDYLYIPLGGNRRGLVRTWLNLAITMLLGGLWHGAAANFILWGAWHGTGLIVNHAWLRHAPPGWRVPRPLAWLLTQTFVFGGWLLFRVRSMAQIAAMTSSLRTVSVPHWSSRFIMDLFVLASPLVAMELWQRRGGPDAPLKLRRWPRACLQAALLLAIIGYWETDAQTFIYFQF